MTLKTVNLEFVLVTQTKKKTQFGFASTFPYVDIPCGPFITSWTATPVIDFSKSALLHKGKAGVQVQIDDVVVAWGPAPPEAIRLTSSLPSFGSNSVRGRSGSGAGFASDDRTK